jgi:UDP-N-acetylmuramate dehydrogenase
MADAALEINTLPSVRGTYTENATLGMVGWFRAGGTASVLFKPADLDDLSHFLKNCPPSVPVTTLGLLSNTIVRDGGVPGVVIRLGREFAGLAREGHQLHVGAALLDVNVARTSAEWGLSGLEFLIGIPGSIGGAIRMNAGAVGGAFKDAYGQTSMKDMTVTATAIDRAGQIHTVTPEQMHMTYRHNDAPPDWIFTSAVLNTTPDDPAAILSRLADLKAQRETAQPVKSRTGGSTFANPTPAELAAANLPENTRVWQVIDRVGGRGLTIGGAQMSEHHCNFMINTGAATAYDLELLGETIRRRVFEQTGLTLRWEIKRIGEFASTQDPVIPFDQKG